MENDPAERIIQPILLDINQIEIESVSISQLATSDEGDDENVEDMPLNVGFRQTLKNGGKLLELDLQIGDLKLAERIKLAVLVQFVSRITNTLQGIYKVDYRDDFGATEEWVDWDIDEAFIG